MDFTKYRKGNKVYISENDKTVCTVNERLLENVDKLIPIKLDCEILVEHGFKHVESYCDIFYKNESTIIFDKEKFIFNDSFEIKAVHELQNIFLDTTGFNLEKPLL